MTKLQPEELGLGVLNELRGVLNELLGTGVHENDTVERGARLFIAKAEELTELLDRLDDTMYDLHETLDEIIKLRNPQERT